MENAVRALEYAFAMLIFVIALSVSLNLLIKAKTTGDIIFDSIDKTTFYESATLTENEINANGKIVSIEKIIPTLYRDYKENYVIEFYTKDKEELIIRFDLSEETSRRELWTGNPNVDVKKRLDIIINGGQNVKINGKTYDGVINNQGYIISEDYAIRAKTESIRNEISTDGLYEYCKDKQFVEEYAYLLSEKEYTAEKINQRIDKIVIRYVEFENIELEERTI